MKRRMAYLRGIKRRAYCARMRTPTRKVCPAPADSFRAGLPLIKKYRQGDQDNRDDPQDCALAAAAFLVSHESRVQHSPNRSASATKCPDKVTVPARHQSPVALYRSLPVRRISRPSRRENFIVQRIGSICLTLANSDRAVQMAATRNPLSSKGFRPREPGKT
jgi:hypothetical protein